MLIPNKPTSWNCGSLERSTNTNVKKFTIKCVGSYLVKKLDNGIFQTYMSCLKTKLYLMFKKTELKMSLKRRRALCDEVYFITINGHTDILNFPKTNIRFLSNYFCSKLRQLCSAMIFLYQKSPGFSTLVNFEQKCYDFNTHVFLSLPKYSKSYFFI